MTATKLSAGKEYKDSESVFRSQIIQVPCSSGDARATIKQLKKEIRQLKRTLQVIANWRCSCMYDDCQCIYPMQEVAQEALKPKKGKK